MSEHIHPLVLATVEDHRARRELELERLRSARNACTTASPGGQSRAMALGKKIREVEAIVTGWRLAMATLLDDDPRGEACPHDCDNCHDADCPCPRMGCAGDPDRENDDETATDLAALIQDAKGKTDPDRIVAYRGRVSPRVYCVRCWVWPTSFIPLTPEDLPDGGVCHRCHADVLA